VYPATTENEAKTKDFANKLYFYGVSPEKNELSGFKVSRENQKTTKIWNLQLPFTVRFKPAPLTLVGENIEC
jgi:hypothetical protein